MNHPSESVRGLYCAVIERAIETSGADSLRATDDRYASYCVKHRLCTYPECNNCIVESLTFAHDACEAFDTCCDPTAYSTPVGMMHMRVFEAAAYDASEPRE